MVKEPLRLGGRFGYVDAERHALALAPLARQAEQRRGDGIRRVEREAEADACAGVFLLPAPKLSLSALQQLRRPRRIAAEQFIVDDAAQSALHNRAHAR